METVYTGLSILSSIESVSLLKIHIAYFCEECYQNLT